MKVVSWMNGWIGRECEKIHTQRKISKMHLVRNQFQHCLEVCSTKLMAFDGRSYELKPAAIFQILKTTPSVMTMMMIMTMIIAKPRVRH